MNLKIGKGGAAFLSTMLISVGVLGGINLFTDTPPVANAGIDQTVELDTIVQFDGSGSVGDNLNYTWYLRTNGDVGYGVSPTHTFTEEGIYEVALLVRETTSFMMGLDTVRITVRNQIPIADAGPDQIVNEDDAVVFDASGTADSESDMATLLYEWDFADGMKGQGISPTHVYTRSGTYNVVLTVTDRWGAVGTDTVTVTVNNPAPVANAGSDKTVNEGEYVYFDGSGSTDTASDMPALRYGWDFGDGGAHATNVWKDDGTYPVTLTVTDDDDAQSQDAMNVHVRNVDPIVMVDDAYLIADITLRVAGERWHDVEMYLNESGTPREEFYVYREAGDPMEQEDTREKMKLNLGETWTAEVRYTPMDDPLNGNILGANPAWIIIEFENGAFRKIQHAFNVARPETWNWNITLNDYFFLADNKLDIDDWKGNPAIHFDYLVYDPGMDAETVTWACGGDTVSKHYGADAFPTFIRDNMSYTPKGDMQNITVTVEDDDGGFSSTTLAFSNGMLSGLSPKVSAGDDGTAIEDWSVPFSGSAKTTVSRTVTDYQWSFGDGHSAPGPSAEHAYAFSGTYYAVLRAWDDLGNTGMDIARMDISNADPVAVAGPDQMAFEDKLVHFDASGSSDTTTDMNTLVYEWNFGDGTVGYGISPSHVYSNAGSYTVTLTVIDNDHAASVDTLSVTVSNLAPTALAGPDRTIYGAPMSIEFVGMGLDTFSDMAGLTYSWNFGDGTQATGRITAHTYSAAGTYAVVLTVRDDDNAMATDTCSVKVGIDSDGDNLGDAQEILLGTDPNNWDTDGDHISDYWEIYVYGTDPALSDSDDDGLADWYEIAYLGHDVDVDGDGLMCPWDWDSDGDWIRDGDDPNPLVYNHADGTLAGEDEIITVNNALGVSVIIDYDGTSTAKAVIAETVPPEPLNKPVGPYLSITTSGTGTYTAVIRIRVPDTLPAGASEERLAIYRWDGAAGKWLIAEKTGVDLTHHFVWARTSGLSTFAVGDSDYQDSDEDGLTDWFELTTYHPIQSYDFETGAQGWTATEGEHLWELQSGIAHSGAKAWHAGGWYGLGSYLTSPWIDLGIAKGPRLTLWHRSGAEGSLIDYTNVKVYAATGQRSFGILPASVNAWSQVIYDLSGYEGMAVQLEFYFHGYETSDHRYLDDISLEGRTDELVADTDGDTWTDLDEVTKYYTNPINPDTDGDGVPDYLDMDPLVDLEITVKITEILALDDVDSTNEADFYVRVTCDRARAHFLGIELPGYWEVSKFSAIPIKLNADHLTPADLEDVTFTFNVPDDEETRIITIDLFDDDGGGYLDSGDDWCDISKRDTTGGDQYPANAANDDGRSLILTYSLRTGQWSGDDSPGDPNGYGHVSGNEDGSTGTSGSDDQDDCELWFDITQNDADADGLTWWEEVEEYGTDPTSFTVDDVDGDGLTGTQEKEQGSKPFMKDSDGDGLTDYEEYQLGTGAMHWSEKIDLYYRKVIVRYTHFETEVKKLTKDERDLTHDEDISLSEMEAIDSVEYVLYPSIGCPEFIDKSTSLTLEFSVIYGTIDMVFLSPIDSTDYYVWDWGEISLDDLNQDGLGRWVMNCSVVLDPSTPEGLYDLRVTRNGVETIVPHSVKVLDNFKSPFSFIQLTDIHIGANFLDPFPMPNVGDFLALINRINRVEKPDFIIITGDLTDGGTDEQTRYFKTCLLKCDVPVFLTPGNHDYGATSGWPHGTLNNYNAYLNPKFDSGNEGDLDDYSFIYGDYHFIAFNSGHATAPEIPPRMSGLTTDQLNWMKSDYNTAIAAGQTHTFIFTHGPIVGHGGEATHDDVTMVTTIDGSYWKVTEDRDIPFVEWVNNLDPDNPCTSVEAVFCGHTHQNHLFYSIDSSNLNDNTLDDTNCMYHRIENRISPYTEVALLYSSTYYLEVASATTAYTYGG